MRPWQDRTDDEMRQLADDAVDAVLRALQLGMITPPTINA